MLIELTCQIERLALTAGDDWLLEEELPEATERHFTFFSGLKFTSLFAFLNDLSHTELLSKNNVMESSSELSTFEHCQTTDASRRSKTLQRAKIAARSRSHSAQIVEQLPNLQLVANNHVKKEPSQDLSSLPYLKLESQAVWNAPSEGSCLGTYCPPMNERMTYLTRPPINHRQRPSLDLSSTTRTVKMEPPQMEGPSSRGLLNGAVDELRIQSSENQSLKKRSSQTAEIQIEQQNDIEINKTALVLPGLHHQRPVITTIIPVPHKKPRRTVSFQDSQMTVQPCNEYKKPSHLDPCPVIEELGRCKIGSQLYIGANWEDRPGVCDPRLTKLCFTTCDKSIKDFLHSGKATIGAKVFYCDPSKNVKAEGWITVDGILCSRCGFVLGCREFKACAGIQRDQKGTNLLLISGAPLTAKSCKF